jgi:hypothetical protein
MVLLKELGNSIVFCSHQPAIIQSVKSEPYNKLKRIHCTFVHGTTNCECAMDFQYHPIGALKLLKEGDQINLTLFLAPSIEWNNDYHVRPLALPPQLEQKKENDISLLAMYGSFMKAEAIQFKARKYHFFHFSFGGINAVVKYDLSCKNHTAPAAGRLNAHIQLSGRDCRMQLE